MLYVSKNNLVVGERKFTAGVRYTFDELKDVDLSNFDAISTAEAAALDAKASAKKGQAPQSAPAGGTKTPDGAEEVK